MSLLLLPPLPGPLLTPLAGAPLAGEATPTPRSPSELERGLPTPLRTGWDTTDVWVQAITFLDLLGVFAFAVSGALLAARKNYDIVGSLLLGGAVGLGGGLLRDVILDRNPPAAFSDPLYLLMVVLATAVVWLHIVDNTRGRHTIQVFDAVGLAVFCVLGTRIALIAGYDLLPAALLGATSAVGGGLLRDVIAGDPPAIFGREGWYAAPAFLGALVAGVLGSFGWLNVVTATVVMAVVLTMRLIALRQDWKVPSSVSAARRRRFEARRQKGDETRALEIIRAREEGDDADAGRDASDAAGEVDVEAAHRRRTGAWRRLRRRRGGPAEPSPEEG